MRLDKRPRLPAILLAWFPKRRIQRRLAEPDAPARLRELLETEASPHRTGLADRLCIEYDVFDPAGHPQRSSCLKALRTLAGRGHFVLPRRARWPHPRTLEHPVPSPEGRMVVGNHSSRTNASTKRRDKEG